MTTVEGERDLIPSRLTAVPRREAPLVRERLRILRVVLVVADALTLLVSLWVAATIRFDEASALWDDPLFGPLGTLTYTAAVLVVFWFARVYDLRRHWRFRTELVRTLQVLGAVVLATLGLLYLLKVQDVSRAFIGGSALLVAVGLTGSRIGVRAWFRRRRSTASHRTRHLLIVGAGDSAARLARQLTGADDLGIRVVGYVDREGASLDDYPRLGSLDDVGALLSDQVIDEIAICLPPSEGAHFELVAQLAEEQGKVVRVPVEVIPRLRGARLEDLEGLPVLSLHRTPDHRISHDLKRMVDVVVAGLVLIVLSPVLGAIVVALYSTQGRPLFYSAPRVGLHGRQFAMHKFRTMVPDAEALLEELAASNQRLGAAFKLADDPRVTPLGRWLRRFSFDELPQLLNVLKGEMSLVGPRPPLPREVALYESRHRRRLSMKPGMTGLWQVSARGEPDFERWVDIDLDYIDRWSLYLDAKILAMTATVVLRGTGT